MISKYFNQGFFIANAAHFKTVGELYLRTFPYTRIFME